MADLFTESHGILARWRNRFSQLLDVLGVNDCRKTGVYKTDPIGPEPFSFVFEMAIEKVKGSKSPGIDHIPAEMFKA
jgi:hypothetical protein